MYKVKNRTVPTVVSGWVLARTDGMLPSHFPPPHTSLRKVQIRLVSLLWVTLPQALFYGKDSVFDKTVQGKSTGFRKMHPTCKLLKHFKTNLENLLIVNSYSILNTYGWHTWVICDLANLNCSLAHINKSSSILCATPRRTVFCFPFIYIILFHLTSVIWSI